MNILHMKYAVEVAKTGTLAKAAEILLIAQPNISRSIKELEGDLGITIFERTAKGMKLTHEGEEFIGYAKNILEQIEHVENIYKDGSYTKQRFSVSVPRACYISEAFADFSKYLTDDAIEVFYKETNSKRTIHNLLNDGYELGIVRYAENYDKYFKELLEEKSLNYELVAEFKYKLIMSKESDLANKSKIGFDDLKGHIEIAHADPYVPNIALSKVKKDELPDNIDRRIYIFERASQFDLLSENKETYMWVSLTSDKILERYNLVQRECEDNNRMYKDVLIYKKGYKFTDLDKQFITSLCNVKRKYI